LQLIDDAGNPTPILKNIKSVPEANYKATLAEWVKSVYAEVFSFVDPETDDAVRVRDAFRTYVPHGQQSRMVALFLALCAEAGITSTTKKNESRPSARKANSGRSLVTTTGATASPARGNRRLAPPQTTPRHSGISTGLHPALIGLIQSIPPAEIGWTQAERDKFYGTFGTLLDYAVPIVASRANSQADDADE
jgi:hypothetical protein